VGALIQITKEKSNRNEIRCFTPIQTVFHLKLLPGHISDIAKNHCKRHQLLSIETTSITKKPGLFLCVINWIIFPFAPFSAIFNMASSEASSNSLKWFIQYNKGRPLCIKPGQSLSFAVARQLIFLPVTDLLFAALPVTVLLCLHPAASGCIMYFSRS